MTEEDDAAARAAVTLERSKKRSWCPQLAQTLEESFSPGLQKVAPLKPQPRQ